MILKLHLFSQVGKSNALNSLNKVCAEHLMKIVVGIDVFKGITDTLHIVRVRLDDFGDNLFWSSVFGIKGCLGGHSRNILFLKGKDVVVLIFLRIIELN